MTVTVTVLDWMAILPALIVMGTAFLAVGIDLLPTLAPRRQHLAALSLAGVIVASLLYLDRLRAGGGSFTAFGGALVFDDLASLISLGVLAATGLVLVGAASDTTRREIAFGEYYGLLLLASSGMLLLAAAADFLTIFLSLEIVSLALYVLTGITRKNPRSNEAAVKYLVAGAFATCFLLMGIAFVYGTTGSMVLAEIGARIASNGSSPLLVAGFGLVAVGFAFKVGAAPFHMWVADVYEGAPTSSTAYMSVTVKAAGLAAFTRVLLTAAPGLVDLWADLLWWMAVLTMALGNLIALRQTSVKRMLAFSSVAHTGYALIALAATRATDGSFDPTVAGAGVFYLISYTFMTLGAFYVLVYLGHEAQRADGSFEWQDAETFEDLAGAAERHPWAAFAMTIFVISLGGFPPTAGFVGKFAVFSAAVAQGHVTLVLLGVLASLISLYYYLRVVVAMYMTATVSGDERPDASIGAVVALSAAATLLLGILPSTALAWALRSVLTLA